MSVAARRPMASSRHLLLIIVALFMAGCDAQRDAARLTAPPPGRPASIAELEARDRRWWSEGVVAGVTDPARLGWRLGRISLRDGASLAYWVVDPLAAPATYRITLEQERRAAPASANGQPLAGFTAATRPPMRTILLLHGLFGNKYDMAGVAMTFANHGYRAICVDLRGHGASAGGSRTFGVREPADIAELIDALEAQGLVAGRLGVLGISYGGAIALLVAAHDPRFAAVAAIAPYVDPLATIRRAAPLFFGWRAWLMSDAYLRRVVETAFAQAGGTPQEAAPLAAAERIRCLVLLVHAGADDLALAHEGFRMAERIAGPASVVVVPDADHTGALVEVLAWREVVVGWFDAQLPAAGGAPP